MLARGTIIDLAVHGAERSAPFAFQGSRVTFATPPKLVTSPCIGVCTLDAAGYCIGCLRTGAEIGAWLAYTDAEREHLVSHVLPQRESTRDGG